MPNLSPTSSQSFTTPEYFAKRTFLHTLDNLLAGPEDLVLHQPDAGYAARIRDGIRIRDDFRKVLRTINNPDPSAKTQI